ncbi:uncharacterized protein METZ01_LOCUS335383, partial [marine metagenome]
MRPSSLHRFLQEFLDALDRDGSLSTST